MAFGRDDFRTLLQLLEEHPEWRVELRRLVLTEELLSLPQLVRELAEEVRGLAEAQRRTEERVGRLEQVVVELGEAQRRTEEKVASLAAEMRALAEAQRQMAGEIGRLQDRFGTLQGKVLEVFYREKAPAILGKRFVRVRTMSSSELVDFLHRKVEEGLLSPEHLGEILEADLVVKGRERDGGEVFLVWEVSSGVGQEDVKRAVDRARLLARAVPRAIPVVAGEWITPLAEELTRHLEVVRITDGKVEWPG